MCEHGMLITIKFWMITIYTYSMLLLLDVVKEERSSDTVFIMEMRNVPQKLCEYFSCSKKRNASQIQC